MNEHPAVQAYTLPTLIVAATVGYSAAPILRFADADGLAALGLLLGLGIANTVLAASDRMQPNWGATKRHKYKEQFAHLTILGSMIGLGWLVIEAYGHYQANERRCASIQADMLSPKPRREDGADLFQALSCRPQGDSTIQFLKTPAGPVSPGQP